MRKAEADWSRRRKTKNKKRKFALNMTQCIAESVLAAGAGLSERPCTPLAASAAGDSPLADDNDVPSLQKGCPPDAYSKMFDADPGDFDDCDYDLPPKTLLFLAPADTERDPDPDRPPLSATPPRRRVSRGIYSAGSQTPAIPIGELDGGSSPSPPPPDPIPTAPAAPPPGLAPLVSPRTAEHSHCHSHSREPSPPPVPAPAPALAVRVASAADPLCLSEWPAHFWRRCLPVHVPLPPLILQRYAALSSSSNQHPCVAYLARDSLRVSGNLALQAAAVLARQLHVPLVVVVCVSLSLSVSIPPMHMHMYICVCMSSRRAWTSSCTATWSSSPGPGRLSVLPAAARMPIMRW